jgi:hypothetical protein
MRQALLFCKFCLFKYVFSLQKISPAIKKPVFISTKCNKNSAKFVRSLFAKTLFALLSSKAGYIPKLLQSCKKMLCYTKGSSSKTVFFSNFVVRQVCLRARISFDRLAATQTSPPKNSLKNPGFSELPKATSNLNFLLWPKVYLSGSLQKAGRCPCTVKNKNIPQYKGLWYKTFFFSCLCLIFFSYNIRAQNTRITTFEDRPLCEQEMGVWRHFGNRCANYCNARFDEFAICAEAVTFSCDCGKNKCWNGEKCILTKDYKKIFEVRKAEEKKILDEKKDKRREAAKENQQLVLNNLIKKVAEDKKQQDAAQQKEDLLATVTSNSKDNTANSSKSAVQNDVRPDDSKATPLFLQKKSRLTTTNNPDQNNVIPTLQGLPQIPLPQ